MASVVTKTVKASGGDYSSLSAWEADRQRDLVSADEIEVVECYNDWPSGLSDSCTVAGWTTDSTRYIVITSPVGERHNGIPGSGFFITASVSSGATLAIQQANTIVEFIEVVNTQSNANGGRGFDASASDVIVRSVLASGGARAFNTTGGVTYLNCIAYNCNDGFWQSTANVPLVYYNCTAYGHANWGFTANSGNTTTLVVARNCVAVGGANPWVNRNFHDNTTSSHNATSVNGTGLVPGTTGRVINISSSDFVNAAGNNFNLAGGSALLGAGANLSSSFSALSRTQWTIDTSDVAGNARSSWDIGAFAESATAIEGELAETLGGVTSAAAGNIGVIGDVDVQLTGCDSNALGYLKVEGGLTETLESVTLDAAGATNDFTVVTKTIRQTGGDYTSLSAWEAARQRNLVAANEIERAVIYDDFAAGLNDVVNISGWTTGPDNYIIVTSAEGTYHNGIPGAGSRIRSGQAWSALITVNQDYTILSHLDVRNTESNSNGAIAISVAASNCIVHNCIARAGREAFNVSGANAVLINCIGYESARGFLCAAAGRVFTFLNCSAINCSEYGFVGNSGTTNGICVAKNCVAYGGTAPWANASAWDTLASKNNATSWTNTSVMPGSNKVISLTAADFVDVNNFIYRPTALSKLNNAGADLSTDFASISRDGYTIADADVATVARPQDAVWDIGAFERPSLVTGTVAETLGAATGAASGSAPVIGSLDIELADTTGNAVAFIRIDGPLVATLGRATANALGAFLVTGSVDATLGEATSTVDGKVTIRASLDVTLDGVTSDALGHFPVAGTVGTTLETVIADIIALTYYGRGSAALPGVGINASGSADLIREPGGSNCERCGQRYYPFELRREPYTGLRVCSNCFDPYPPQRLRFRARLNDPRPRPHGRPDSTWAPTSFILRQVHGLAGVGTISISNTGSLTLTGVAATPGVGQLFMVTTTASSVSVPLIGLPAAPAVGTIAVSAALSVALTGVAANAGVGDLRFAGAVDDENAPLTGVFAVPNVGSIVAQGSAYVEAPSAELETGVGDIEGSKALKWPLPIPLEDYTVIDLDDYPLQTTWDFRVSDPNGNYLFLGASTERTVQRLYVRGGANIAIIGGKYVPGKDSIDPHATVSATEIRESLFIEGVVVDNSNTTRGAYGTPQSITAITKANPAVVTYSGADNFSNGMVVYIQGVNGMTEVNGREFVVANVNTTNNTFQLQGVDSSGYGTYISGGDVRAAPPANGEKDALGYGSDSGYRANVYIQNCVLKGVRGRQAGQHGDCVQRYGPADKLHMYNVVMETSYQAVFLRSQTGFELNAIEMENVSAKWTQLEQDWQWCYYFYYPGDHTGSLPRPVITIKNVYISDGTPYAPEWRFVMPNSTDSGGDSCIRIGNQIEWPYIDGVMTVGLPSTPMVNEASVGIGYQHGQGPS